MIKVDRGDEKCVLVPDEHHVRLIGEFSRYSDFDGMGFYVTLGFFGREPLDFDNYDWDGFVKFVNEIDVLVKEQNNG